MVHRRPLVLLMRLAAACLLALVSSGCLAKTTDVAQVPTEAAPAPATPAPEPPAPAASLRVYPRVPRQPQAIAERLVQLETLLRSTTTDPQVLPDLGHEQQVIYRRLSATPGLAAQVRLLLPSPWTLVLDRHLAARREFLAMHRRARRSAVVPAWRILAPEPAQQLLRYFHEASAATGIPWEVLAAVNLVETGMGRIDGISVADARGPMQFLPSTWAEPGIGQGGDIRRPRDAIHAAARYLVRRGGLKDIRKGLWGYNNSDHYVKAVLLYAGLLKEDPAAFTGLYHWEIHFLSTAGDLWLPVGYNQPRPLPVDLYLRRFPVSAPPAP